MDSLRDLLSSQTIRPEILTLAVLAVSIVLAWLADLILTRILLRLTLRTATDIDDRIIRLLHRPVFLTVLLIGFRIALGVLGPPASIETLAGSLFVTLGVLVWLGALLPMVDLLLGRAAVHPTRFSLVEPKTLPLFTNLVKVAAFGLGLYWIIEAWGVNPGAWLASAGIVGLAVGFAAKDTLANLFAGVFILVDAPYKMGDFVNLDTGERGEVSHIGIRSTRLITRDDIEITVPNAVMGNAKIVNETGGRWSRERIRVRVGVAYGSDIDHVKRVLEEVGTTHPEICRDPEPRARFRSFGDSGLDLELLCWIEEPVLRGRILDALNTEVYKRFAVEGIEIPYPKRDVYIKELPGAIPPETSPPSD